MEEDFEGGFDQLSEEDKDLFDEENLEELAEDDEISSEEEGFMSGYRDALKRAKNPKEDFE
ncbi:hypothetical protein HYT58_01570 [Candidatus Woesearchaeota archaeon]|nr:hypothetical protein [Candidatus Woesearchaeota archaeon]